jgi:hypothetical protein
LKILVNGIRIKQLHKSEREKLDATGALMMTDAFPIFIGITGKRELSKEADLAQALEDKARERFKAVFDYVDDFLPSSPKILLTGGATGADLMVAEEILGLADKRQNGKSRQNWLVVVVLPFEQSLFQEDFTPEQWAKYQRVVEDKRTHVVVLPPLKSAGGLPATAADLHRRPDATDFQKDLRRRHYEQVGLWIADTANVLLAVMAAGESSDRVGGTARIVACRRSARPDPVAAEVISASSVLVPRAELYRAPNGYVWLIDPSASPLCSTPPVTVLPPAADNTPWPVAYQAPASPEYWNPAENDTQLGRQPSQADHLEESRRVLKIAHDYIHDNDAEARPAAKQESSLQAWPIAEDRAQLVARISSGLRNPTNKASEKYRRTIYELVVFFALAVLAFEIFAKFLPESAVALLTYLVLLGAVMIVYWRAGQKELQPIAEDRRAIREALRVQGAWWQAGLDDRVDFEYLKGADQDLARVREAIRNVIVYSSLVCDSGRHEPDWTALFDPESWPPFHQDLSARDYPKDWIGNQYYYFRQRKTQRHLRGEFVAAMSLALFATAACLAAILLAWLICEEFKIDPTKWLTVVDSRLPYWSTLLVTLGMIASTIGCWWLGGELLAGPATKWRMLPRTIVINLPAAFFLFVAIQVVARVVNHTDEPLWMYVALLVPIAGCLIIFRSRIVPDPNATRPVATITGLAAAVVLSFALMAAAALYSRHLEKMSKIQEVATIAQYMTIVLVVFLPTLGGAMRFLSEKLAIEAEALSYRDAHVWFEHAKDLLCEQRPGRGDHKADQRAEDVIRRLGNLAISENEAWLKLRRERPLSPVI